MSSLWHKVAPAEILSMIVVHASPTLPFAFQWSLPVLSPITLHAPVCGNHEETSRTRIFRCYTRQRYPTHESCLLTKAGILPLIDDTSLSRGGCDGMGYAAAFEHHGLKTSLGGRASTACLTVATIAAISPQSVAASSGGRIGGEYTPRESFPSVPPMQQELPRQSSPSKYDGPPRTSLDIDSGDGNRIFISYRGNGPEPKRLRQRTVSKSDFDNMPSSRITAGDTVVIGTVTAGVLALQRYNQGRYKERGELNRGSPIFPGRGSTFPGGTETAVVTTIQIALFCERRGGRGDALETLRGLSQTADVKTREGLASLVNEVCLTLLRSEGYWVGATGGIKEYTWGGRGRGRGIGQAASPSASAKRDFNRIVTRERSKVEYEAVSTTPNGARSHTNAGESDTDQSASGTYAVITLMIRWAGLRSTPLVQESRKRSTWFSKEDKEQDKDILFSIENRQSAMDILEYLGDEAAEGKGQNVLNVEVLWAPAEDGDSLTKESLYTKWPELRQI